MKRRIISAVLAAAMIVGTLAGCGGGGENAAPGEDKSGESGEKVKLTLWHMEETDSRVQAFQEVIKKYNESQSEVRSLPRYSPGTMPIPRFPQPSRRETGRTSCSPFRISAP